MALNPHLLPYLEQYQNVLNTNQMELTNFSDYEIFRNETAPPTLNTVITIAKDFCKN